MFYDLVTNYNQLAYQITTNIIEGASYEFIAKAVNKWGEASEWSDVTTILAATTPKQVENVTSMIDPVTGGIRIDWASPHHRGSAITEYQIRIQSNSGSYEVISQCTSLSLSCTIPMDTIRQSPYLL